MKRYLFVSPHLDDAVLSCGVYIHKLVKSQNKVEIVTIFSGSKDSAHLSYLAKKFNKRCHLAGNAMMLRRQEDKRACKKSKITPIYLNLLECLYRDNVDGTPKYSNHKDIFRSDLSKEVDTIQLVISSLKKGLNLSKYDEIYIPLGIGRHIDHLIARLAIEKMLLPHNMMKIKYYEDIPYVCHNRDKKWKSELTNNLSSYTYSFCKRDFRFYLKTLALYKSQKKVLWYTKRIKMTQLNRYFKKNNQNFSGHLWTYRPE